MKRKVKTAVVVSAKMKKTVIVEVEKVYRHPLYQKIVRMSGKFKAHDESGRCRPGDRVEVMETRPLSGGKHWRVVRREGES